MYKRIGVYFILYVITAGIIASVVFLSPTNDDTYPFLRFLVSLTGSFLLIKYVKSFIYMNIAPWYLVQKKQRERKCPAASYNPLVSVIIPAYNEEIGLVNTVKTILLSEYKNLEVIVVNDGSTDKSHERMTKFAREWRSQVRKSGRTDIKLKYSYKENGGKGRALNHALRRASGDIIITIDADCAILPQTIGNFVKPFADPTVSAAVGNVKIGNLDTVVGVVQYLEFLFSFYFKKAESVMGTIYIIGGAAGAFRRDVFRELGKYNHSNITEDIELSVRIQQAGKKIVYADDALVYTEGASTVASLAKQRTRWKRGWFQTFYQNPALIFSRKKQHNKILSWFLLPLGFYNNGQLIFEPWFMLFLYVYSYLIQDFSSFITWMGIESTMFYIMFVFEQGRHRNPMFLALSPIGWLLFYVSTYVEYRALLGSIWATLSKREIVWQKWERRGMMDGIAIPR